jgi:hypothetical protein
MTDPDRLRPPAGAGGPRHGTFAPALGAGLVILAVAGCGDGTKPVSGLLLVDGKPAMEGARVVFHPLGNSRQAFGTVGPDGTFEIRCFEKKGVMPGDYKVTLINSTKSIPTPDFAAVSPGSNQPPPGFFEWQAKVEKLLNDPPKEPGWIPVSYASLENTPLKFSVPKDGPVAKFDVESPKPTGKGK